MHQNSHRNSCVKLNAFTGKNDSFIFLLKEVLRIESVKKFDLYNKKYKQRNKFYISLIILLILK